jgi:hypothetical protein
MENAMKMQMEGRMLRQMVKQLRVDNPTNLQGMVGGMVGGSPESIKDGPPHGGWRVGHSYPEGYCLFIRVARWI